MSGNGGGAGTSLAVRIAGKRRLTSRITEFDLRATEEPLPRFTAGAHINVRNPAGEVRSYSLCNAPSERHRYVIAVAREEEGRGGSKGLTDETECGDSLWISPPRNDFELRPALRYLLIAGGVGITPLKAMYHQLTAQAGEREPAGVRLLYLSRSEADAAYLSELAGAEGVVLHHSGQGRGRLDLWPYLAEPDEDTRIYCCGPPSLIADVRALTMHWRPSLIRFENFAGVAGTDGTSTDFTAVWHPTGERIPVPATETLLGALRAAGIEVASSCSAGTCGTCKLRVHEGFAEHRDLVLSERERRNHLMPCVSRAASETIVVGPRGR
ncbi:PDR/VanB family oxidoreductase [Saccharomonospora sp. NPDC006951]